MMKDKRVGIVCCSILAFVFSCIVASYLFSEVKKEDGSLKDEVVILDNKTFEYASSFTYDDFLTVLFDDDVLDDISNVEIMVNDEKVLKDDEFVFNDLGTYVIGVSYDLGNLNYSLESTWTIEDTLAPKFEGITNFEITLGDELNYQDSIKALDECDGEVEVTFEGEVNNSVGSYKLVAVAKDSSGNEARETFYVIINDTKTTTTVPTTKTTSTKTTKSTSSKTTMKKTTTTVANDASTKEGRLSLAKAEAKVVVSKIIKAGMTDREKAIAIANYLYQNVATQHNQSTEAYKTNYGNEAYAALVMKIAACSGFCKAVTLLCDEAGLKSKHINANQWTHQWNTVYVDGEWQVLDAQIGYFGGTIHPILGE